MEDLARYDVIFIGDVGLGSKGLTEEQASLLKGMVKTRPAASSSSPATRAGKWNS